MSNDAASYYPSPSQRQYFDDTTASTRWMQKPASVIRSRQTMLKPISLLKPVSDGVSFVLIFVIWLVLRYFIKPFRRPFLCSDLDLYHPKPPHEAVPTWLLFVLSIAVPMVIILVSEGVRRCYLHRRFTGRVVYKFQIRSKTYAIPEWFGNLYITIGTFMFFNVITAFLTNIGKITVGRLRPHFIPSCFEKYSYTEFCKDANDWITNYTCIGESSTVLKLKDGAYDIRQSFPSGHSSTAFCGLIFLALYIHKTWSHRNIGFLPYVMETACFGLAAYIGISRVTDNRHHPTDVLAGAILGTAIAIIGYRYMVRSFKSAVAADQDNGIGRDETDLDMAP